MFGNSMEIPDPAQALPGRDEKMQLNPTHYVHGRSMVEPFPSDMEQVVFGMGCFWGAERKFWSLPGIHTTAVGYVGGHTPNPSYQEVCSGMTGHNEVVLVVYDPAMISFETILTVFWESHNPTQGMRQGNDMGTQYRSGIYFYNNSQRELAESSKVEYESRLKEVGLGPITTEILQATEFYYAEDYHQQYLAKNPSGYCGIGGVGVKL